MKYALEARDLEISASNFISDFETNIPNNFKKVFPGVKLQGCFFHFGKAIWSRVKSGGVKSFYSSKSCEKNFGFFIRLILGTFMFNPNVSFLL